MFVYRVIRDASFKKWSSTGPRPTLRVKGPPNEQGQSSTSDQIFSGKHYTDVKQRIFLAEA